MRFLSHDDVTEGREEVCDNGFCDEYLCLRLLYLISIVRFRSGSSHHRIDQAYREAVLVGTRTDSIFTLAKRGNR